MAKNNTLCYSITTNKFFTEEPKNLLYVAKKEDVGQTSLTQEEVKFCLRTHKNSISLKNAARLWQLAAAS